MQNTLLARAYRLHEDTQFLGELMLQPVGIRADVKILVRESMHRQSNRPTLSLSQTELKPFGAQRHNHIAPSPITADAGQLHLSFVSREAQEGFAPRPLTSILRTTPALCFRR